MIVPISNFVMSASWYGGIPWFKSEQKRKKAGLPKPGVELECQLHAYENTTRFLALSTPTT